MNPETLPEDTPTEQEIEYVDIGGVTQAQGIAITSRYAFGDAPSRARRRIRQGDTIVSTVRTYLRAVAYVSSDREDLVASTGFAVLRAEPGIDGRFLSRAIQSEEFIGQVVSNSVGISYPAIAPSTLGALKLVFPSADEQTTIASFLDAKTTEIDQLIAKKQRLIELLEERRAALITQAVTKGLDSNAPMRESGVPWAGRIPAHWEITRNAYLFRERFEPGLDELPILMVSLHTGVSDGSEVEDSRGRTRRFIEDRTTYKRVYRGDLVFNMMRAWQGAFGVAPTDGLVSPAYTVARPLAGVDSTYFAALFRTSGYMKDVERFSYGVADFRWRLYWENFRQLRSFVPPVTEQKRIIAFIGDCVTETDRLGEQIRIAIERLREYRSALISAAVTGRIDVRNYPPTVSCQ
jgi:type I restriction enzyme S subunit